LNQNNPVNNRLLLEALFDVAKVCGLLGRQSSLFLLNSKNSLKKQPQSLWLVTLDWLQDLQMEKRSTFSFVSALLESISGLGVTHSNMSIDSVGQPIATCSRALALPASCYTGSSSLKIALN
jgi:hypothetical protein